MKAVRARLSRAVAETLERRMLLSLSPAGPEFRVNTFTTSAQRFPAVASDADGDFVVAWESNTQDGSGLGVYAQRYNGSGVAQGPGFRVNTFTTGNQSSPAVAMDADGDFVVVWESYDQDGSNDGVFAQRYDSAGVVQGPEFRVNTYTLNHQDRSAVAMNAAGDFVVAWRSLAQDGSDFGIFAQRYHASGVPQGAEFRVNTYTTVEQLDPAVAIDAAGNFVVVWESAQDGSLYGVYGQRYNASGVAQAAEFRVNTYTSNSQNSPAVAMETAGHFVVAWQSLGQDDSVNGIFGQRYKPSGVPQGVEFQVNTFTDSNQSFAAVTMDADGDFVVAWESSGQDVFGYGVSAQRYNASGVAQDVEFRVNTFTTGDQREPAVAMNAAGDFVVAWASNGQDGSNFGTYAQRYDESTDTAGPIVAGVFVDGKQVTSYSVQAGPVSQLVVSFSENVSVAGGPGGVNSVTNPANWQVVHKNGLTISDVTISGISYLFNAAANRYEATLQLSGSFSSGNLQVVATSNIRDVAGNALDGNLDGVPDGGGTSLTFAINAPAPRGGELPVNTYTTSTQNRPAIAGDAEGNFVVTWSSFGEDGSNDGIYAQRFSAAGVPLGGEFRVNSFTTGVQFASSIAVDADGDFVIVWTSAAQDGDNYGVYAQRYNAAGVPQGGEFRVNATTSGRQFIPAVAADADGDFVVAWGSTNQDGDNYGVYAQRYNAAGVAQGGEFRVNSYTTGSQNDAAVAADADGDFVITWRSSVQDSGGYGVYAQRYNSAGVPQGGEIRVNSHTTDRQFASAVAVDADGDFVITWTSENQDGGGYGIYRQRFNAAGVPQGGEFRVNSYTTGHQAVSAVAADSDGDFVVSWQSDAQDGSAFGIYAQRYNAAGVAQGDEFRVNSVTAFAQVTPTIATDADGDFVVAWASFDGSSNGIFAQRYDLGATPIAASLSDAPDSVTGGNPITLTAGGVSDDGSVSGVSFYRESNGTSGLQFGTGGDTLVGSDTVGGDGWYIAAPTTGLFNGTYTYYAAAFDNENLTGAPASTTNTVTGVIPTPLTVNASSLEFETRQAISLTFNNPLNPATVSAGDLAALNLTNASTPVASSVILSAGNTVATWVFNAPGTFISNGNYRFTLAAGALSDTNGSALGVEHQLQGATIFFLAGDSDHDRDVDVGDLGTLASNWQQSGRTFSQGNFDYSADGLVNVNDLGILASNWQQQLAAPSPPFGPAARSPQRRAPRLVDAIGVAQLLAPVV